MWIGGFENNCTDKEGINIQDNADTIVKKGFSGRVFDLISAGGGVSGNSEVYISIPRKMTP